MHRLKSVQVVRYPVLHVTFDDGMTGEIDLGDDIKTKPMFAELQDQAFFGRVTLRQDGSALGWKLDRLYEEIDLSADGLRVEVETELVKQAAARYRAKLKTAE